MPIKKLRFSFDLDMTTFLSMVAAANSGMKIDVYGDEPKAPRQLKNGHAPKLLSAPSKRGGATARGVDAGGNRATAYDTILGFLVANKDRGCKPVEIQPQLIAIGLSAKSVSPQLTKLRHDGFVKKNPADGLYHVTARGIAHQAKAAQPQQQASE